MSAPEITTADGLERLTIKALELYVGGLSRPRKMPCYSYSLPAEKCRVGSRSWNIPESVCGSCYAHGRGSYIWPNTIAAMDRRLAAIEKPYWAEAMAELIRRKEKSGHFRWHDSGDIQSLEHFRNIVRVADLAPEIEFWIPTREYRTLGEFDKAGGICPPNLHVRASAMLIGGHVPTFPRLPWVTVSTVSRGAPPEGAHRCPAPHQDGRCGDCRACWNPDVRLVDYALH